VVESLIDPGLGLEVRVLVNITDHKARFPLPELTARVDG